MSPRKSTRARKDSKYKDEEYALDKEGEEGEWAQEEGDSEEEGTCTHSPGTLTQLSAEQGVFENSSSTKQEEEQEREQGSKWGKVGSEEQANDEEEEQARSLQHDASGCLD